MDEEKLFLNGIKAFNRKKYYEAHEHWEEIWTELNVDDSIFIQGLIQLSVGFFHITNSNIKGAKSLFRKFLYAAINFVLVRHSALSFRILGIHLHSSRASCALCFFSISNTFKCFSE